MVLNRKKIVISGAVFCTIIIIAGLLVALQLAKHQRRQCELVDYIPTTDLNFLTNYPSVKLDAIANFAGYLIYEADFNPNGRESNSSILPLILNYFYYDTEESELMFKTDCCYMRMLYRYNMNQSDMEIYMIDVSPRSVGTNNFEKLCEIEPEALVVPKDKRYACHTTIRYACHQVRKDKDGKDYPMTVAWLAIDNLEIELGGDPESHENGEFSKPEKLCFIE